MADTQTGEQTDTQTREQTTQTTTVNDSEYEMLMIMALLHFVLFDSETNTLNDSNQTAFDKFLFCCFFCCRYVLFPHPFQFCCRSVLFFLAVPFIFFVC